MLSGVIGLKSLHLNFPHSQACSYILLETIFQCKIGLLNGQVRERELHSEALKLSQSI